MHYRFPHLVRGILATAFCSIALVASARAEFNISESTGLFAPSFRGGSNATWFGYSCGTFFGNPVPPSSSRILNNTPPTLGDVGLGDGVEFYQNYRANVPFVVIGSSSGNIYTGQGPIGKQAFATMVVPTDGSAGTGFTTLILQGFTSTAGPTGPDTLIVNYPRFSIGGVEPSEFVIGGNAVNAGQWWARFDVSNNQALYTIDIEFPGGPTSFPISIAGLTVDSYWSADGYAADTVVVPEPSSFVLLGLGVAGAWLIRRRARRKS
jgi:hypothetical protein